MPPLPIEAWTTALDRMTAALDVTRAQLDQHRAEWAPVVDIPATASPPELLLAWLERRLVQWDARLSAAVELAAEIEQQLHGRESTVTRWQASFDRWRNLIEQGLMSTAASPTNATG